MLDTGNHSQVKLVFYMAKELEHQTTPQVMRVQALPKKTGACDVSLGLPLYVSCILIPVNKFRSRCALIVLTYRE
jgi:hypothetical protein